MITELKKKEIISVKEMMDAHKKNIEDANKGLESITEKYKRLMEEEKKSLKESLSDSKSQLKMWEKMFNSFDSTAVKEALGDDYVSDATDSDSVEETDVTDESVVDTLFGQEPEEPEKIDEVEKPVDNSVSEQESDSKNEHDDIWGYGSDDESANEDESEQKVEPKKTDEASMSFDDDNDDEWPDMPDF